MRRRIALFGGSFDPFHVGHFLVAQAVRETTNPHKVVFLPCSQSPLKASRPVATNSFRLRCLREGLRGVPWAEVSDWEIQQKGPSYSIHTIEHWRRKYPRVALDWVLGSDQWRQIRSWRNFRLLGKRVRFLVFPRPDIPRPIRGLKMTPIPLRFDVSASQIRKRLHHGQTIKGMVLPEVEKILRRSRCYR